MIKIDDKGCQFSGTAHDLDAEYSQLTSMYIQAKMEGGDMSFFEAVDEVITDVQFAVNYHLDERGETIDWEKLKKSHSQTRVAMSLYSIMGTLSKLREKIKLEEGEGEEGEEDDG